MHQVDYKAAVVLAALIMMVSSSGGLVDINVHVSTLIDGRVAHEDVPASVNGTPQRFLVVWENTGSVGCDFRLRVDVYNSSGLAYTAWSSPRAVEPGGVETLDAYWYPEKSGGYSAKPFLYFCNSIQAVPAVNFSAAAPGLVADLPAEVAAESTEDYVEFRFKPREDMSLVIVPRNYPAGWAFSSQDVELAAGREEALRVEYSASIWKEKNVTFDLVSSDGRYRRVVDVELKKKEEFPIYQVAVVVLALAVIILLVQVLRLSKRGR